MIAPDIIEPQKNISNGYSVEKYDDLCEPHFKIKKIVGLRKNILKIIIDVILNICTVGIINYFYGFYAPIIKFMRYVECPLEEATILGIYCQDDKFYFEELKKEALPVVDNPDIFMTKSNTLITYLFTFKLFTYIYNPTTNAFTSVKYNIYHTKEDIYNFMINGLRDNERIYQKKVYGDCDLNFHIDPFLKILFTSSCTFFFAFQIYSIILWNCTEYYAYAGLIAGLTVFDLFEQSITTLLNLKNIRKMAKYSIPVKIYKRTSDGQIETFNDLSINLVPGDIFEIPDTGLALPCDCILLSGSVIINEAMLTGESTPIIKSHLPNIKQNFDEEMDSKFFLFAGTKVVQKRPENKKPVIGLVYSIGFNTVKGNLIRSILYPLEVPSKFEKQSAKFIGFMAILCVVGYMAVLPFKIQMAEKVEDKYKAYKEIVIQFLDLITTAVPPSLPCCLGVGIGIAQRRFRKRGILCINRNKITSCGRIDVCVFDKTGTLTEDHLNISGFLPVEAHSKDNINNIINTNLINTNNPNSKSVFIFDKFYENVQELSKENYEYYKEKINNENIKSRKKELRQLYIECLACCQGITRVDGKLVGDPIDVEMFESTGWEMIEDSEDINNYNPKISTYVRPKEEKSLTEKLEGLPGFNIDPENPEIKKKMKDHYELGIIRRFDFSSKLQRMSTLAKNLSLENNITCYCKGSPEKIKELCQPKTIPENFVQQLNYYTSRGYRVLAMGCKIINMDYNHSLEISRSFCEKDLIFLGLLIVQNKLKLATNPTLRTLSNDAQIRIRMATGDNILTAVCVGRKSNLIEPNSIVYSCEIEEEHQNNEENKDDKSNIDIINDSNLNSANSLGIIENSYKLQKEKEKKKKTLVWKTIESFQEDEDKEEDKNENEFNGRETFLQTDIERPSFLIPQNFSEEDCKIENEGNQQMIKIKEEKKEDTGQNEEEDNLIVDLDTIPFNDTQDKEIEIAITGKTFEVLYKLNKKYEDYMNKKKNIINTGVVINDQKTQSLITIDNMINEEENRELKFKGFHDAFRLVLKYCSVYARCSPENKAQIVQSLQNESFTVLMCGDGANDCSALKVADVGISLSTEEASIAAPFTSHKPDISCVIDILKEGKCALVSSLEVFKYILLYSLIQFISVTLLILIDSYLSDWEFMASDLFLITPLAVLMPLAPAYPKLTSHRPVSSLFSFSIIFSMAMQTICVAFFQIGGNFLTNAIFPENPFWFFLECNGEFDEYKDLNGATPWIKNDTKSDDSDEDVSDSDTSQDPEEENDETLYMECINNSTNFYISFGQYLILAIVFCTGKPFKKNIFFNYLMLIFSFIGFLYAEYIVLYVDSFSRKKIYLTPYPDDHWAYFYDDLSDEQKNHHDFQFKFIIMGIIVANFFMCLFIEKVIVYQCSKCWRRRRMNNFRKKIEADIDKEATLYLINDVKNYIKEQKIHKKMFE